MAIVTALKVESEAIRSHLKNIRMLRESGYFMGDFIFNDSLLEVVFVEAGAHNPETATATMELLHSYHPDVALFVGIAGGLKEVNKGDVVVVDQVFAAEYGKVKEEISPTIHVQRSSHTLLKYSKYICHTENWIHRLTEVAGTRKRAPDAIIGHIISGEKVIKDKTSEYSKYCLKSYPWAIAVEEEGYGFLTAAHTTPQIDAIVIRGISDLCDDKDATKGEGWQKEAAENAAAFAFELLRAYGIIREEKQPKDEIIHQGEVVSTESVSQVEDEKLKQDLLAQIPLLEDQRRRIRLEATSKIVSYLVNPIGAKKALDIGLPHHLMKCVSTGKNDIKYNSLLALRSIIEHCGVIDSVDGNLIDLLLECLVYPDEQIVDLSRVTLNYIIYNGGAKLVLDKIPISDNTKKALHSIDLLSLIITISQQNPDLREAAIEKLYQFIPSPSREVRRKAIQAIEHFITTDIFNDLMDTGIISVLKEQLKDDGAISGDDIERLLVHIIQKAGIEEYLLTIKGDESWSLKWKLASSLQEGIKKISPQEVAQTDIFPHIIDWLSSDKYAVCSGAASIVNDIVLRSDRDDIGFVVSKLKESGTLEKIIELLSREDPDVQIFGLAVISNIIGKGKKEVFVDVNVIEPLRHCESSTNEQVKNQASRILSYLLTGTTSVK
ncbi:MAG: hypothetical protein QME57_03580 [Patescibacteria group bacterium]|nr:hypothetical protein [Patescibacteria group bacterium]